MAGVQPVFFIITIAETAPKLTLKQNLLIFLFKFIE